MSVCLQRDSTLGRMLFTCVFSAIFGDVDKQLTEGEAEATKKAVRLCLNDILTSSTLYHPSFIGSLQVRMYSTCEPCL